VIWNIRSAISLRVFGVSTSLVMASCAPLSRLADRVVFNSAQALREHAAIGYDRRRAVVIPNGAPLPPSPRLRTAARVVGTVARFDAAKDYPTFLKACATVAEARPDLTFLAAGRGVSAGNPAFRRILDRSGLAPDRIELLDEVVDPRAVYGRLDLMVVASRLEGLPNALIEAMGDGAPCVGTRVGDIPVVIGDERRVVRPGDAGALARAILAAAELPPSSYGRLSLESRDRAETLFSLRAAVERFEELLAAGPATRLGGGRRTGSASFARAARAPREIAGG
jgi:glycosyltransferase involved in cell wall biosynthesis